ncbi:MAG: NERD domain-containing protein [Bacilli bacterium]|nr:NERD domain-containing protein [Bacilli bacterium]
MIYLTNAQATYIIVSVIAILIAIILIIFFVYKFFYAKKHYKDAVYLKLANLAKINDFLLLNNYAIDFDDTHVGIIDHILISKKYIFVINDFALSGVVSGDLKDRSLRVITSQNSARYISNPLNYNINLIKRLNLYNHLDQTFVKGIVTVNNDCHVNISSRNDQFTMLRRKDLRRFILKCDKDNVKPLKENEIVNFINKLDKQNRNRRINDQ